MPPGKTTPFAVDPQPNDEAAGNEIVWPDLPKASESIVVLREGDGEIPLILLHGGSGTIHSFGPCQRKFRSALWAIQVTPDTPKSNLWNQAGFYVDKIQEKSGHGPYRLAAFSATAIISIIMAYILEQRKERVIQLSFIDHFPSAFFAPGVGMDLRSCSPDVPIARREFVLASIATVCALAKRDGGGQVPRRHKLAEGLWAAAHGQPVAPFLQTYCEYMTEFLGAVFDFLHGLQEKTPASPHDKYGLDPLKEWMQQLSCPVTVYVAVEGIKSCVTEEFKSDWKDLGTHYCLPRARVVSVDAAHFDILGNDGVMDDLQSGFLTSTVKAHL